MTSMVFLGTKPVGFRCLQHLLTVREQLGVRVLGVMARARQEFGDGHDLCSLAQAHDVPVFASLDEIPPCDIVYSVQCPLILKREHIARARRIAVNLHMAPLPEYRGSNQFTAAILDRSTIFGTTIHAISPGVDQGDILFERRFEMDPRCWVHDLYLRTAEASVELFCSTLADLVAGRYTLTPQAALEGSRGTHFHFRREITEFKRIDLAWDAERIARHVRATSMPGFEPPYAIVEGRKVHLCPAQDDGGSTAASPAPAHPASAAR